MRLGIIIIIMIASARASLSVCRVIIFKVTGPSPLRAKSACAKRAAYQGLPPVVPHPESLAAQAAYAFGHSAIAQVGSGPNCFQVLGSSPGLLQGLSG